MPDLSLAQIAHIASNLGHANLEVVPMGRGTWWMATCSCGYHSTRRRTQALAADAAAHHVTTIARAFLASGRDHRSFTLPPSRVAADTPQKHAETGMSPPAARV
jgi:hypothetical protein